MALLQQIAQDMYGQREAEGPQASTCEQRFGATRLIPSTDIY